MFKFIHPNSEQPNPNLCVSDPTRGSKVHIFGHPAEAPHRLCFTTSALASIQRTFVKIRQRSLVLSKEGDKHLEAQSSQPEGSYEAAFGELKTFPSRRGAERNTQGTRGSASGSTYSYPRLDPLSERGDDKFLAESVLGTPLRLQNSNRTS